VKTTISKEILLLVLAGIPSLVLVLLWDALPQEIPTHYNLAGEADDWTSKENIHYVFGGLSFAIYALMLVVPLIDPKGQISKMGNKYFLIRAIMGALLAAIFTLAIIAATDTSINFSTYIPQLLFLFFIVFGNYLQSVKPNYFIGIRTPWALEDKENWKKTHRLGGRVWVFGGLLMLLLSFFLPKQYMTYLPLGGTMILVLIPAVYSYILYANKKKVTG